MADVLYHEMVLLIRRGLKFEDVLEEQIWHEWGWRGYAWMEHCIGEWTKKGDRASGEGGVSRANLAPVGRQKHHASATGWSLVQGIVACSEGIP
ncbi:hypothetical protein L1987_42733 [Smallanthus sonchifolius]|uniref:Uncharacterized protein n=1 Tax=Smallanthus sonchifolius TaxID=185202 RepID=A0ACB9GJS2_9ASTR|nr:hypothetical protein L1987_42733 [Smallanthus sonchifolius]